MPRLTALFLVVGALVTPFWWFTRADEAPADAEIVGEVRDDAGPIAGAMVRFKGRAEAVSSNGQGRFRLPFVRGATRLTASSAGHFIAGASPHTKPLVLHLERLPTKDCERYAWVDPTPDRERPANCGNCHQAIYDEWRQSGHARAATNRRFHDLYDDLRREHPLGADVCSSCHAPTQKPGPFGAFDMRDAAQAQGLAGVHCDYCHKVQGSGPGTLGLSHGRYQLSLLRPDPEGKHSQLFFGPLDDVDRGEDVASQFQRDSRYCAACHEGVVFGVPVYSTYSEWKASPAARAGTSCQSCHMTPTGTMTNIAPGHGGVRRSPATLGNHLFFDGSRLDMLRHALKLETAVRRLANSVEVDVELTAENVGHRVPTGFIDRQMILFVDGYDRGRALPAYQSPLLPEALGADEAGRPGRLYARVLTDGANATPLPFWRGDPATLTDTRLRPGETDRLRFRFPIEADRVRVRLVHRRFWKAVALAKHWETDEQTIVDETMRVP
jgi:hypothetical protein